MIIIIIIIIINIIIPSFSLAVNNGTILKTSSKFLGSFSPSTDCMKPKINSGLI